MAEFAFHHGGVSMPSLDDAIEWYGRMLGFEVEKRFFIAAARSHAAMVKKGALGKGCFIRDCAGNLIEFVEDPGA